MNTSSSCPGTYNDARNEIASPNFPLSYGSNEYCQWNIQAPSGKQIALSFDEFETEHASGNADDAKYDHLTIYDGKDNNAQIIGNKFNGTISLSDILSSGNNLHLSFKSNSGYEKKGFQIHYQIHGKYFYHAYIAY